MTTSTVESWQINSIIPYDAWADLSPQEFRPVADAQKSLVDAFMCSGCHSYLSVIYADRRLATSSMTADGEDIPHGAMVYACIQGKKSVRLQSECSYSRPVVRGKYLAVAVTSPNTTPMDPCCSPRGSKMQVGSFCRCCGEPLRALQEMQECGRQGIGMGPCPYCAYPICGVHSARATEGSSPRRFCELCGSICDGSGECPVHSFSVATGRFGIPVQREPSDGMTP